MTEHQLPEGFSELEPWVDDWALATRAERYAARLDRPYDELVAFYDAIAPHAERAIAYLDGLDINDLAPKDTAAAASAVLDDPGVVRGEHLQAEPHPGLRRRVLRDGRRTSAVSTLPLHGLRVVEAATLAAGPMVGTALGEFGAEVIKVEQPGAGDPMRTWGPRRDGIGLVWKSVSRNKRCVTLDLRPADGPGAVPPAARRQRRARRRQPAERAGALASTTSRCTTGTRSS